MLIALGDRLYSRIRLENRNSIIVFPEGQQNRKNDKSILPIKTGFFKSIQDISTKHKKKVLVVPVTISYDNVCEQGVHDKELESGVKSKVSISGLFSWVQNAISDKMQLGNVYIRCGNVIELDNVEEVHT